MSIETSLNRHVQAHPAIGEGRAIALVWTIEDILEQETEHGYYPIGEDDAVEILSRVRRNYDASLGIGWDDLEHETTWYLRENNVDLDDPEVYLDFPGGSADGG